MKFEIAVQADGTFTLRFTQGSMQTTLALTESDMRTIVSESMARLVQWEEL